jgi:hypothetical protein
MMSIESLNSILRNLSHLELCDTMAVTGSGLAEVDARIKRGHENTMTRSAADCAACYLLVDVSASGLGSVKRFLLSICNTSYILISSPLFRIDATGEFSVAISSSNSFGDIGKII